MPLTEVIRAVTSTPAASIGWGDRIGSLTVGREADVTVLSVEPYESYMEDCQMQRRLVQERFVPRAVWRAGRRGNTTQPLVCCCTSLN
jgi:imidazolonepropionase-like amidohydrolase